MIDRDKLVAMVSGLKNGEPDAASELYETFQSDIYYFILKTVRNDRELAEDLTQDTFVEILETVEKLQEPAAFVTWSKQIAYHKCTAYFRKRKELLADEDEDGYSVFDNVEEERDEFIPDAALDKEDLKQTILGMINELSEEQRSAVILRYFNEISVKEIAQIQGVSEGTVKSRLNYGRKAIKQSVEEYEKKNDVKLHSVAILPMLLWLFRQYRLSEALSMSADTASQTFMAAESAAGAAALVGASSAAATAAAATASTTTVTTAVTTATTATTAATAAAATATAAAGAVTAAEGAATVSGLLSTKVIAIVAAAAVTIGGTTIGLTSVRSARRTPEENTTVTVETVLKEEPTIETEVYEVTEPNETAAGDGECQHEWMYRSYHEVEYVYEENICVKCGEIELLNQEPNPCEHEWERSAVYSNGMLHETVSCTKCRIVKSRSETEYSGEIGPPDGESSSLEGTECTHEWELADKFYGTFNITDTYVCVVCGTEYQVHYENPCVHDYRYKDTVERNGSMQELWVCLHCGTELYDPPEDWRGEGTLPTEAVTCEHEWELVDKIVDSLTVSENYVCTKCGIQNSAVYDNTCEHDYQFREEVQNGSNVDRIWECVHCGLEYYNPPDEWYGEDALPDVSDPTEATTCEHQWYSWTAYDVDQIYEYEECSTCHEVTLISQRENTCEHIWNTRTFADPNTVCGQEECVNCTAVRSTWEHQWEEQTVLDEQGNVLQTSYYCPNCTATK